VYTLSLLQHRKLPENQLFVSENANCGCHSFQPVSIPSQFSSGLNKLLKAAYRRLVEEFEKLDFQMNQEKTWIVDLRRDETFNFLGFDYRRFKTRRVAWGVR
jgi:hypothetical protein